jgi:hypothetical protein
MLNAWLSSIQTSGIVTSDKSMENNLPFYGIIKKQICDAHTFINHAVVL